ncbi:PQ-loop repeat-containing protein [Geotalea sp. SG265]|uniref:PQ-loop repeat-containing protein n=1 Tax=Geotalea sp. SG265 TaxID=2922867 RepID=UPI001FAF2455|nr:PQ-loop repeat-containing protein [Geotalea sp. SG265]
MIRSLYALNGIVAVLLYLPQIRSILKNRANVGSFSLVTFGGWSVGSVITTLYAWTFVRDPLFGTVSLANMLGSGTVFSLVAASRLKKCSAARDRSAARNKADGAERLAENFG